MIYKLVFFSSLILLGACKPGKLRPAAFARYCEDKENGLKMEKTVGDIQYTLQYEPLDYAIVMREKKPDINEAAYLRDKKDLEGLEYFSLKIKSASSQDPIRAAIPSNNEYFKGIEYLSFDVKNDLKVVEGKDTLPCQLSQLERMYGIAPYITLVLAFKSKTDKNVNADNNGKIFIYSDKVFGTGDIKMVIKQKNIDHLPQLSII